MALADLQRLDALYRRSQLGLQAGSGVMVKRLFERIPPKEVVAESSTAVENWLVQSTALTLGMRRRSVSLAQTFYDDVQDAVVPGMPHIDHEPPPVPDIEQLRTSLFVTGVVRARTKIEQMPEQPSSFKQSDLEAFFARQRGDTPERSIVERQQALIDAAYPAILDDIMETSGEHAGAAAARHVGNGGREQIQDSTKKDRRAIGFIRITGPSPCYFCAMLAGRGPVFSEDSFEDSDMLFDGAGHHKVHDNCACSMRQVYSRNPDEWPQINQDLELGWLELSDKLGRSPGLQDWRNHYEGRAA
jgi:hypothetical protein